MKHPAANVAGAYKRIKMKIFSTKKMKNGRWKGYMYFQHEDGRQDEMLYTKSDYATPDDAYKDITGQAKRMGGL